MEDDNEKKKKTATKGTRSGSSTTTISSSKGGSSLSSSRPQLIPMMHQPSPPPPPPPTPQPLPALKRRRLVMVWNKVANFADVGIKERTWWHLRRLREPILGGPAGQESSSICVAHCVLSNVPAATGKQGREARRGSSSGSSSKKKSAVAPLFSSSSSPSTSSSLLATLASSASSAGSMEEGHGLEGGGGKGTPTSTTTTTLDFCMGPTARNIIQTASTSPGAAAVVVDDEEVRSLVLAASTQVFFVYKSYRIVICLHISRSLFCFQGQMIPIEQMESTLVKVLTALVTDIGSRSLRAVDLRVSVLACDPDRAQVHRLVQGYPLSRQTLPDLLSQVGPFLTKIENKLATSSSDENDKNKFNQDDLLPAVSSTATAAFEKLIEASLFALQFMPPEAAPSIVLLVDGVFQLGTVAIAEYNDTIMQLSRDDIPVSVVCLCPFDDASTALGYVADVPTLQKAVESTGGSVLRASDIIIGSQQQQQQQKEHAIGGGFFHDKFPAAVLVRRSRLNLVSSSLSSDRTGTALFDLACSSGAALAAHAAAAAAAASAVVQQQTPSSSSLLAKPGVVATPKPSSSSSSSSTCVRDKLKMYTLPLVRLQMLLGLRAAEGFQATVIRVGGSAADGGGVGTSAVAGKTSSSSARARARGSLVVPSPATTSTTTKGGIADITVLVRLTRFLDRNLSVEYTLEYVPILVDGGGMSGMGSVNVTIDVVGSTDWIQAMTDPQGREGAEDLRQSLRRFLRAVQDMDFDLYRFAALLKPPRGIRTRTRATAGKGGKGGNRSRRKEQENRLRGELLWLAGLPLEDWSRWLRMEYFELVTMRKEEEEEEEDSAEEVSLGGGGSAENDDGDVGMSETEELRTEEKKKRILQVDDDVDEEAAGEAEGEMKLRVREDLLLTLLGRWCSFHGGKDLFVKVFDDEEESVSQSSSSSSTLLRFCLLRLVWASDHVVRVHMGFFGLEGGLAVRQQVWQLQQSLISTDGPILLPASPLAYQLILPPPPSPSPLSSAAVHHGNSHHQHTHGTAAAVVPLYQTIKTSQALLRSYLHRQRWTWPLGRYTDVALIIDVLTRAQVAKGFTLVHRGGDDRQQRKESLLIQHIPLSLEAETEDPSNHHRQQQQQQQQQHPLTASRHSSLVQYRVVVEVEEEEGEEGEFPSHKVVTEMWMEPQFGFGSVDKNHQTLWRPHSEVWKSLAGACYERDRRLLSALDSFFYIRHLCSNDTHTSMTTTAAAAAGPGSRTSSSSHSPPSDLNLLEMLRGAEKMALTMHLFLPLTPDQLPPPGHALAPTEKGKQGTTGAVSSTSASSSATTTSTSTSVSTSAPASASVDLDANNRNLHRLTERTLRTLLGAEIPISALVEGGKGQDLLWKVELGLTDWREGKCFAHQMGEDSVSLWFLPPYRCQSASMSSSSSVTGATTAGGGGGGSLRPQMDIKIFVVTSKQLLDRLVNVHGQQQQQGHQQHPSSSAASSWPLALTLSAPLSANAAAAAAAAASSRAASPLPADNPLLAYISYLHRRNFTQVAYMALRAGRPIVPADLREALGFCSEIGMDVDLTHLRKIAVGTAEVRQSLKYRGMMTMTGGSSSNSSINSINSLRKQEGGKGGGSREGHEDVEEEEEEESRESDEVVRRDKAKPLGKGTDREFLRAISSYLAPVPGTDFFYYVGSEKDLHEAEDTQALEIAHEGPDNDNVITSSMTPTKIYMRKASNGALSIGAAAAAAVAASPRGSSNNEDMSENPRGGAASPTGGIAGLFQQGHEAELGMMLKMLDVKRRTLAQKRRGGRNRSHSKVSEEEALEEENFVTPCFVRFEVVHALYGLAQSQVFRLSSATPPSTVLPFCFDDAVAREDMWVAPRVSRQASSISIICATHSRLDVTKYEAALEEARRQGKGGGVSSTTTEGGPPSASASGESSSSGLSKEEVKDLMLTTHKRFLRLVRRRVEAWAAAETLRCLLSLSPLPTMAVPTVLQCLKPLPPELVTRFHVNLVFVVNLPNEARGDEHSDDEGIPSSSIYGGGGGGLGGVGGRNGKTRRMSWQRPGQGGKEEGDLDPAGLSAEKLHEEEAIKLFHEHLTSCRFLPVRCIAGMYFLVEPALPPSSFVASPLPTPTPHQAPWTTSAPTTITPLSVPPPTPPPVSYSAPSEAPLATCEYILPYWAVLQVRRRKTSRLDSVVLHRQYHRQNEAGGAQRSSSSSSAADGSERRQGQGGNWAGPMHMQEEGREIVGYIDSFEVVVSLHHPPGSPWYEAREEVMENARTGIAAVCTHVNQILLLRHLHDTRQASSLLIAPTESDLRMTGDLGGKGSTGALSRGSSNRPPRHHQQQPQSTTSASSGAGAVASSTRGQAILPRGSQTLLPFYYNSFKCPRLLTLRFPVFHRLTPAAALRALESDVLHPLTVQNRVHTFVHRDRHGRVSYLRFDAARRKDSLTSSGHGYGSMGEMLPGLELDSSEHSLGERGGGGWSGGAAGTGAGAGASFGSTRGTGDLGAPTATMTLTGSTAGATACIDCHVHGVDEVGEELSVQLHRLLESRLAEIAIFHLSELLSRNPRLQLTAQDLELIESGTTPISASAAVAAMGGNASIISAPTASSTASASIVGAIGGKYRALLELPGGLLRYGDPYLFLLYLRQNTARAQFINNVHVASSSSASGPGGAPGGSSHRLSRAPSPRIITGGEGEGTTGASSTTLGPSHESSSGAFGSGRGIVGLTEVWAPEGADASTWHPSRIGYTGARPLEPLSAATSHPAFWSLSGGVEVEIDSGLLNLYYNHNRPEIYEAGRKDVTSTLSSRGARLAKEVGKGLALINVQPVDAMGRTVRRLRSAVSVTEEEVDAVVVAAAGSATGESSSSGGGSGGESGSGESKPVPWATSILKSLTSSTTAPMTPHPVGPLAGSGEAFLVSPTPVSPPPSTASSCSSYNWFQSPMQQPGKRSVGVEEGEGPETGGSRDGDGKEGGEVWGISVEVLGSVKGEPLMEWLKLCVDQALHDYFIERLLAFIKNPPPPSSSRSFSSSSSSAMALNALQEELGKDNRGLGGRVGRALRPWDQLVASSLLLDSPSVRRQEATEVIPLTELVPLVQVVCRAIGQTHPFIQSTMTLLHKQFTPEKKGEGQDQHTGDASSLALQLRLLDPQTLAPSKQDSARDRQFILLGGLRVMAATPSEAVILGTSPLPTQTPTTLYASSRTFLAKSQSTENLPPADALYPTLTASEGATASMAALRMTNRDTACVVRITADSQSLVLYNCHPELAGRCTAAFGQALALAALERFVAEGIALQKVGLLPLDFPWWRRIPSLRPLVETKMGLLALEDSSAGYLLDGAGAGAGAGAGVGVGVGGGLAAGVGFDRNRQRGGERSRSRSSNAAVAGTKKELALPSSRYEEALQRGSSYEARKGSGAGMGPRSEGAAARGAGGGGGGGGAGGGGGGGGGGGMVMTPAMAARLRASGGRKMPMGMMKAGGAGGVGVSSSRKAPGAAVATGGSSSASSFVTTASTSVSSSSTSVSSTTSLRPGGGGGGGGGGDVISSSSTGGATGMDLIKRGGSIGSVSSLSDAMMVVQQQGPGSMEVWLTKPQEWMAALLANASPSMLEACRRLSRLLRGVLPAVWSLKPFELLHVKDSGGGEGGTMVQSVSTYISEDPGRMHIKRLWKSTFAYFHDLESDAHLKLLCRTWTWYQHFLILQRRGAHLQSRVRRPLDFAAAAASPTLPSPSLNESAVVVSGPGKIGKENRDKHGAIASDSSSVSPMTAEDLQLILRRARWHGSSCLTLIQRSFDLPSSLSTTPTPSTLDKKKDSSLMTSASVPVSPVHSLPSPSPRPPSRSGAMTPAPERRGGFHSLIGSSPISARYRQPSPAVSDAGVGVSSPSPPVPVIERPSSAAAFLEAHTQATAAEYVEEEEKEQGPRLLSRSRTIAVPPSRMRGRQDLSRLTRGFTVADDQQLGGSYLAASSLTAAKGRVGSDFWGREREKKGQDSRGVTTTTTAAAATHEKPQAPVANPIDKELLQWDEDDYLFAKAFLDRYVGFLQVSLKMVLVPVGASPAQTRAATSDGEGEGEAGEVASPSDWSKLCAYLHRFVALTNTVTLVEVRCERRRLPSTKTQGRRRERRLHSEVRIKLSVYTIDVHGSSSSTSMGGSNNKKPEEGLGRVMAEASFAKSGRGERGAHTAPAAAWVAELPTTHTFVWSLPNKGASMGGNSLLASHYYRQHAHGYLQLPQDVALTIGQLELETHVFDFLVGHVMSQLLAKGRAGDGEGSSSSNSSSNNNSRGGASDSALALLQELFRKNPEPPSHSQTAVGVRYLCQPVHEHNVVQSAADSSMSTEPASLLRQRSTASSAATVTTINMPDRQDLLQHLQDHAHRHGLWPLHEVDKEGRKVEGVVGAVSLKTWLPLDPNQLHFGGSAAGTASACGIGGSDSRESEETLIFILTLAAGEEGTDEEESMPPPAEFVVYIMHRKGKERGQRGYYMEIPGHVERLLARILEEASFDNEREHIWNHVEDCLAEKTAAASASWALPGEARYLGSHTEGSVSMMVVDGVSLAAPTPVVAPFAVAPSPSPPRDDDEGRGGGGRGGVRGGDSGRQWQQGEPLFRWDHLNRLLCFSLCQPLAEVDPQLLPLFASSTPKEDLLIPWVEVLGHLEHVFWDRALVVQGLRQEPGEVDLLLNCHDGSEAGGEGGGGENDDRIKCSLLLHFSVRRRGNKSRGGGGGGEPQQQEQQQEEHPQEIVVQLIRRELMMGERRVVAAAVEQILGWVWGNILVNTHK